MSSSKAAHPSPVTQLRVLSLNCWGLKWISYKRHERLNAIAEWISRSSQHSSRSSYRSDASDTVLAARNGGYDVIALQELWVQADFDLIAERAKESGLLYSRMFQGGAIGSGLAILSAYPIQSSFIKLYPLNGHSLQEDFFAGKAICGITIEVPGQGLVDVLNTHMFAPGGEGDGLSGAARVAQAWEAIKIVREKIERGRHVIFMGDFNSQPYSIIMKLILNFGSLLDSFSTTHAEPPPITSSNHQALSAEQVLDVHGVTCDSLVNSFSAAKLAKRNQREDSVVRGGKRLDYVLYQSPPRKMGESSTISGYSQLLAESTTVVLTELVPGLGCSYSDHFGLEVVLNFTQPEASSVLNPSPASSEDLNQALNSIRMMYRASKARSKDQLRLFWLALVLVPTLAVASSFQPLRYLSWIFVLLGVVTGAGGATMLYTGFVGGQWESGAIKNVMAEMETEMATMSSNLNSERSNSQSWN